MPAHDGIEGLLQRLYIQCASQPHCFRLIVRRTVRLKLIQKPQALLGKGKRHRISRMRMRYARLSKAAAASLRQSPLEKISFCRRKFRDSVGKVIHRCAGKIASSWQSAGYLTREVAWGRERSASSSDKDSTPDKMRSSSCSPSFFVLCCSITATLSLTSIPFN